MEKVIEQLEILRHFTGNTQLGYLSTFKSDLLKEILEYTYNPHKKYKIDEGKYDKITTTIGNKLSLHQEDWNDFKSFLDTLAEKKSATDKDVLAIKTFIDKYEEADFLKMVLFKDLRLNMNIKKFQKIWPNFCVEPQVQLAQKFEGVKYPYSLYSRKLDGLRAYYKDGVAISRTNKPHKTEPLAHITAQLKQFVDYDAWVYDGEIIYLNPDGTEDFTKAISLARSDNRTPEGDNLYYCIFDMIQKEAFENKTPDVATFKDEYTRMKAHLGIVEEKRDWYVTSQPNILLLKQVDETGLEELQQNRIKYNYEGIMIRNADAHYEYKRSNNIRKIKEMQDTEVKLLGMEAGTGKFANTLGAMVADYNGYELKIGSGFSDEQRKHYWQHRDEYVGKYVKVKYFEKTVNQQGGESLRFPIFLCFRDPETMEEFLTL